MSERGSFVTEYIYCDKCFSILKESLVASDKFLASIVIPSWKGDGELPIIAGKIGGHYPGEEIDYMKVELAELFWDKLCCKVRIAVIPDSAPGVILEFGPGTENGPDVRTDAPM